MVDRFCRFDCRMPSLLLILDLSEELNLEGLEIGKWEDIEYRSVHVVHDVMWTE